VEPYVFVSYQRADSPQAADRLTGSLEEVLGVGSVFKDDHDIRGGAEWAAMIRQHLGAAEAVIVVIGPRFDTQRLHDTENWVRLETQTALASKKFVLPLLVDGVQMPPPNALPAEVRALTSRQALPLRSGRDYSGDVNRIIDALKKSSPATLSVEWKPVRFIIGSYKVSLDGRTIASAKMGQRTTTAPERIAFGVHDVTVETTAAGGIGKTSHHAVDVQQGGNFLVTLSYHRSTATVDGKLTITPRSG